MAALGVAAGITGYAAAWLRQRQHTGTTRAGVPDNHHSVDIANEDSSHAGPQGRTRSAAGTGTHREDAATHVVDLKRVVVRRPGLAIAVTAVIVAVATAAVVILIIAPRPPRDSLADLPPRVVAPAPAQPPATPVDPLIEHDTLIPMSGSGESGRACTADRVLCTGAVFTMNLGGDGPWVVTRVGYRPLEVLPGRRVTRLRWELQDTDQFPGRARVFTQTDDAPGDGTITYAHLPGESTRTMRITAVVEASIPAPDAVRTHLPPFNAYGYPELSGGADFPTRSTPAAITWPTAPSGSSR
ncbi:hypothetical protein JF776_23475 [Mycobacterium avium]|nr:hypothetical protein [Mycobacterium avium]